jgi:hypothetical protein
MTVSVNGTTGITFNDASIQNTAATGFGFKNRLINGQMVLDQRNAGASVNNTAAGLGTYTVDRWLSYGTAATKFSIQQNAGAVTPPAGFSNYLGITSLAATAVGAADLYYLTQRIEGFNVADLGWGTANAQPVTLSFWVRSSLTGTFGGALLNSAGTRSYPFSYTISSANTWTQISITVAGETTGAWLTNNGIGIAVTFGLGVGSTFSTTAGAWATGTFVSATGATSVVGTNGATFYITGVQLEKGSTATSFDYRPYGTELNLCYRYYYKWINNSGTVALALNLQGYAASAAFGKLFDFPVPMRTTPSCSASGTFSGNNASGSAATAFTTTSVDNITASTASTTGWTGSSGLAAGNMVTVNVANNAFIQASAEL